MEKSNGIIKATALISEEKAMNKREKKGNSIEINRERLRFLIESKGYTKKYIASAIGITSVRLSNLLNDKGSNRVHESTLQLMAEYFDVIPEYITGETDYSNIKDFTRGTGFFLPEQADAAMQLLSAYGYMLQPKATTGGILKHSLPVECPNGKTCIVNESALLHAAKAFLAVFEAELYPYNPTPKNE